MLHPAIYQLGVRLFEDGLPVAVDKYAGICRADHVGLKLGTNRSDEVGDVRLRSEGAPAKDGPTVHHRFTVFPGSPLMLVTLTVTNGEVDNGAAITPHLHAESIRVRIPEGYYARVAGNEANFTTPGGKVMVVHLGQRVLQASRSQVQIALIPKGMETRDDIEMPWLEERRIYLDGWARPSDGHLYPLDVDETAPIYDYDTGGATSGNMIRLGDYGAEFHGWPASEAYDYLTEIRRAIMSRPQRCYLTMAGEPLEAVDMPEGAEFSIGPTELLIGAYNDKRKNPWLDEKYIAGIAVELKGSIDLAHADARWIGPDLELLQRFMCPIAAENIRWHAAAARVALPDLGEVTIGHLARQHANWIKLQAFDWWANRTAQALDALEPVAAILADHQTEHGGLCAWDHNQEYNAYQEKWLHSKGRTNEDKERVTRPEQEFQLAYSRHLRMKALDEDDDAEGVRQQLQFTLRDCRAGNRHNPWERCTITGEPRSDKETGHYSGVGHRLALEYELEWAVHWLSVYCDGADDAEDMRTFLEKRSPDKWRNNFALIQWLREQV